MSRKIAIFGDIKNHENGKKKVRLKVVPNNQYFCAFKLKKVEIQNFVILLLKVGHHFNIDWN